MRCCLCSGILSLRVGSISHSKSSCQPLSFPQLPGLLMEAGGLPGNFSELVLTINCAVRAKLCTAPHQSVLSSLIPIFPEIHKPWSGALQAPVSLGSPFLAPFYVWASGEILGLSGHLSWIPVSTGPHCCGSQSCFLPVSVLGPPMHPPLHCQVPSCSPHIPHF